MEFRRVQRNIDRLRAREDRIRAVVFVKRGKNDHLIAGVGDRQHRGHHRLGAAAGDDDLLIGVDLPAHPPGLLFGQRLAEVLRAPSDRILVYVFVRRLRQPVEQRPRRVEVGEALRQIDRAVAERDARHAADDGIGERERSLGKLRHSFHTLLKCRIFGR